MQLTLAVCNFWEINRDKPFVLSIRDVYLKTPEELRQLLGVAFCVYVKTDHALDGNNSQILSFREELVKSNA